MSSVYGSVYKSVSASHQAGGAQGEQENRNGAASKVYFDHASS